MFDPVEVKITNSGGAVVIEGAGSLTFTNAAEFGTSLKEASEKADSVVVDLGLAEFIDTQIVQDLGAAAVRLLKRNKRLRLLLNEEAYPYKVVKIAGFQAIMDIEAIQTGALEL